MRALYVVREHLGVAHLLSFAFQKWQGRIKLQKRVESIKKCNGISGEIFLVSELHLRTKS